MDYGTALHNSSSAWPYYALSNIFVAPNTPATGQPTITGTPRVDEELTAETSGITDPEGTGNAVFTYQWTRVDGDTETDIQGATRSTYTPKTVDADQQIKVRVSFTDDRGHSEGPLVSEPTALIVGRDVLVKNTGQPINTALSITLAANVNKKAQAFTTGTDSSGYELTGIGFYFTTIADPDTAGSELTATLNASSSGTPGGALCTLEDPASFAAPGVHIFTAPTTGADLCPNLSANTDYFAVLERANNNSSNIANGVANNNNEDAGSLPGWSISSTGHTHWPGPGWVSSSDSPNMIEVRGQAATLHIDSDHRTWVDNRQGDAATTYENTGLFSIAQGFRTGDTAGIFEIHEIHVDFDSGHTDHHRVKVLITESTTPEADDNRGTPSGYWKGGQFYPQTVTSGGTVTFPRHSGHNWLEANRNYFLIISSKSASDDVGPTLRLTASQGQTSNDGWTVDNHAYSKEKADHARWTKQDHPVRFRISGQFHQGLSLFEEPHAHESCPNKPCVVAVLETTENMGMEGRRFQRTMGTGNTWISTQENIKFKAALWPIPTGTQWVEFNYYTSSGSATAGEDFQNTSGTVRFSAGDKLKTIKVELIDDPHEDSGELLQMNIDRYTTTANVGGRTYQTGDLKVRTGGGYPFPDVSKYLALGTIHNSEETTGTRYIRVSGATVTEGEETAAEFTISLSGVLTAPVWFNYTTVDGSAVAGTHYTATSGETHIPHGATSVTVPVPILDHDDDVHTGDREFTLQLSKVTVAAIGTDSVTVTIRDDEPQPLIARFTNLPEGNHGETSFNFDISFNQDVATQNLAMQNDVMTVTNGEITSAGRVSGQSRLWRITVQPVDGRDVTVELPATTGCSATGAVCTSGDDPQPLSNSITHTFKGTRLSARFGHHSHHNGADAFTVGLRFSEEPDTTAEELQDHAITTQGGSITSVAAKTEGSTRAWTVTLQPNGLGNVVISLKPPKNCDTGGHICTGGGELLSNGLINTVHGPVQLTVSDAAATEGDDESLTFTVTPNKETLDKFYVSYATSDGTATAGEDYTAVSGVLAYTYGEDPPTVTVPVLSDEDAEDAETVILTLSDPSLYLHIADGEATGTILDGAEEPATPNSPATGLPSITGTPKAGEPLTADISAIADADGLVNVSYSYQWVRATGGQDADIAGAAGSTYTPDNNDVDKTLKVRVSFEDDVGNDESLTSLPTAAVARSTDGTVWSADMLVVEYTEISIGAATADLFSNIGGSSNLQIKSLWSYVPDQDLRLAFPTPSTTPGTTPSSSATSPWSFQPAAQASRASSGPTSTSTGKTARPSL